jgi:hypothetical protein
VAVRRRFDWDDANRGHISRHRAASEEFEQAMANDPIEIAEFTVGAEARVHVVGIPMPAACWKWSTRSAAVESGQLPLFRCSEIRGSFTMAGSRTKTADRLDLYPKRDGTVGIRSLPKFRDGREEAAWRAEIDPAVNLSITPLRLLK